MTLNVATLSEIAIDGDAAVKYKALATPALVFLGDLFQIIENTALKLTDLAESQFEHQCSRFLTTNAARAEHRQWPVFVSLCQLFCKFWKLAKAVRAWIDGVRKGADLDLVVVACIDDQRLRVFDDFVPFIRRYMPAGRPLRPDIRPPERDDLLL